MGDELAHRVEVTLDEEAMKMLTACAAWRKVPVTELVRAYVEDWIDIDYPESQGRLTRRGIYRDGPLGLDAHARKETSHNWRDELKDRSS
ncbi:MAG: ribbon-helix-helix protein, CopG family [Pseudaminobacter sp.]|nr:ribbon-helix-helix protein, CopG family [Pseudaminobacter sp.]